MDQIPALFTGSVPYSMSNVTWESSPPFEYGLISGTWKVAEANLNNMFREYSKFKSCRINENDLTDIECFGGGVNDNNWEEYWYEDFRGPAWYIFMWLSAALIFTLVGMIWCCCNKCLCCCSRGRSELLDLENTDSEFDTSDSRDSKKKTTVVYILGALMALWIIGYSYSTVIAIASNEAIRSAISELPEEARKPLNDADKYLNITKSQVNSVFIDNYEVLVEEIRQTQPPPTQMSKIDPSNLMDSLERLVSELKRSENDLDDELAGKVDPIISKLKSLQEFISSDITPEYKRTQTNPELEAAISITRDDLTSKANSLVNAMDDFKTSINDLRAQVDDAEQDWLDIVKNSVYGTFMTTNVIIILLLIGITVGSAIIWFGSTEAKYTGFILHRFTITTMFVIGWVIVCMMVSGFALAGTFSQIICEGIHDLENGGGSNATTRLVKIQNLPLQQNNDNYVLPSYSYVVKNFKQGKSAYESFDLNQVFDAREVLNISDNFNSVVSTLLSPRTLESQVLQKQLVLGEVGESLEAISSLPNSVWINKLYQKVLSDFALLAEDLSDSETNRIKRQSGDIKQLVDDYANFVFLELTKNIGQTRPLYDAVQYGIDTVCYKTVVPVATYWWAFQFLLIMFVTFIVTAIVTERFIKA